MFEQGQGVSLGLALIFLMPKALRPYNLWT
jgi:hypothetical protein